jgi:hypothetical protein
MPAEQEIEAQISALEGELHRLQLIKQLQPSRPGAAVVPIRTTTPNGHLFAADNGPAVDPARVSPERRDILEAILALPGRQGSPSLVANRLRRDGRDVNDRHIGMNMARMHKAKLLKRVRQGTYAVPNHVAEFVRQLQAPTEGAVMTR